MSGGPAAGGATWKPTLRERVRRFRSRLIIAAATVCIFASTTWYFTRPTIRNACTGRLAFIDQAITEWANDNHKGTLDVPTEAEVQKYLGTNVAVKCPEGGAYQFGTLALATVCSVHGHAVVPAQVYKLTLEVRIKKLLAKVPLIGALFRSRGSDVPYRCITELKQMDGAMRLWALENKKSMEAAPVMSEIVDYLRGSRLPTCFEGGKYFFGKVKDTPRCTVEGHSL